MTHAGPIPIRSQLSRYHTDRRDPERVVREGWKEMGIATFKIDDPRLDDFERQFLTNVANRLYGERK